MTPPPQRVCPLCGGDLRLSHREYVGGHRSVSVLRCRGCGETVRGEPRDDASRPRTQPAGRRKPMPDGGHPDNFVLDPDTAGRLRQILEGEGATPDA